MSLPYFYTLFTLPYVKEWVLYRCQEEIAMKKKLSVIISVICIIVSLGSISGTLYYAKNHNTSSMMQQAGGTPPSMPNQCYRNNLTCLCSSVIKQCFII